MDFATLKADVVNAFARTPPDYIYRLVTAQINRDMRLLDMLTETTLTTSTETVAVPSGFQALEAAYIETSGQRCPLQVEGLNSQIISHNGSDQPAFITVRGSDFVISPTPDGEYTITVNYYAGLDDLSADSDTNAVMARYPGLYLYAALTHAAIWSSDDAKAQTYNLAFVAEKDAAKKADGRRRRGPVMTPRPARRF